MRESIQNLVKFEKFTNIMALQGCDQVPYTITAFREHEENTCRTCENL